MGRDRTQKGRDSMKAEQDYRELSKETLDRLQTQKALTQAYRMLDWLLKCETSQVSQWQEK